VPSWNLRLRRPGSRQSEAQLGPIWAAERSRPVLRRLALVAGLVAVLHLLGPIPTASAHATLLFTTPTVDGAVPSTPPQIQLVFDQPVRPLGSSLRLTGEAGGPVPIGEPVSGNSGQTVTARVLAPLPAGQYLVRWQVAGQDGDIMTGQFRFAVGSTAGLVLGGGQTPVTKGVVATTALRWLLFVGLAISLGGAVGSWLVRRGAPETAEIATPRPWLIPGTLIGAAAAFGTAVLYSGAGSLARGLTRPNVQALVTGTPGRVALAEFAAFGLAAVAFRLRRVRLGGLLLLLIPAAEGVRAHPQAAAAGWGALVTAVHLTAAAIWVGALIHVLWVCLVWRRHGVSGAAAVSSYARLALWLFLTVVTTGLVAGLLLLPLNAVVVTLVQTTYGQWLVAKLALVTLIAGFALTARRHLSREPNRRQPSAAARYEAATLIVVLAISALLTALAPPVRSDAPLPFPPPAVGPIVAVGGRAGWVGVGVTASAGQIVVRLTTPQLTSTEQPSDSYQLAGNLSQPEQTEPVKLRFRRCGTGCFVAPVEWPPGMSTVTLKTSAAGWPGGTTALNIAWPPIPAPSQLKSIVQTMRRVPAFTLHEQVTSDTNQGLGTLGRLALTGPSFLSSEPYGSGIAPTVTILTRNRDEATLALAYPGEGIYALLTVDPTGRIRRETLAAPNHLVSRTFIYPEPSDHER
jgi:copper transport protein